MKVNGTKFYTITTQCKSENIKVLLKAGHTRKLINKVCLCCGLVFASCYTFLDLNQLTN